MKEYLKINLNMQQNFLWNNLARSSSINLELQTLALKRDNTTKASQLSSLGGRSENSYKPDDKCP